MPEKKLTKTEWYMFHAAIRNLNNVMDIIIDPAEPGAWEMADKIKLNEDMSFLDLRMTCTNASLTCFKAEEEEWWNDDESNAGEESV